MLRNYENKSFSYLSESHYESIYVADCNFVKVNHSNFELYDSMIFESQLDYCTFSTARIGKNRFGYSSLSNCSICHTNFIKNEFNDINLSFITFYDSLICGNNFEKCKFKSVMFENVNFENSYFSDCLFHDITLNNCKGFKNAFFENINFGTTENPVILSDEKALQYLLNYNF